MAALDEKRLEVRALNALFNYFWRKRGYGSPPPRDELLLLASYETDEALLASRNLGKASLAWIRAHQSSAPPAMRAEQI